MEENNGPILHVLVVGFHHKKGCQVEYSFPSLVPNAPNECPPGWKYLPTLALPDGSHNYDEDTAYFHLPSLNDPKKTVYGISCYRQIPAEKLKNRTEDITRSTVQKAVCVLSTLPFYGHIQVKMSLITHAYFEEGDFSKVSLLEDTYHHLNSCLTQTQSTAQVYVGLSARDLILQWRHKALLLFKLLLLERRVIFYRSPVQPLCSTILTLLSLHPGMIERGLHESACVKPSRPMSPIPDFGDTPEEFPVNENVPEMLPDSDMNTSSNKSPAKEDLKSVQQNPEPNGSCIQTANNKDNAQTLGDQNTEKTDAEKIDVGESSSDLGNRDEKSTLPRDSSIDNINEMSAQNTMSAIAHVDAESCGTPLSVFTKGYMCLPYLSLPYIDLLSDVNVRGYVVGATNVLFKQKRQLADVLIEVEGARIESQDPELRRQLHLTTEDLRFADFVVKHVAEEKHDVFLDGVGWEGGDEWIRTQFRVYLLCLLRTSLLQEGSRECEHFNSSFITAWKETHNYKIWLSGKRSGILELNPGHPFAGQLSVADMKLRFAHTMQNTEGGRKLNQAMMSTGKAVATTGRAVGGAWTQAKGALSSWWSNLTTVSPEMEQNPPCEGEEVLESSLDDNNVAQNVVEVNINNQCIPASIDNCNADESIHIPNSNSDNMNANPSNGEIINSESKKIDIENETLYKPGEINTV